MINFWKQALSKCWFLFHLLEVPWNPNQGFWGIYDVVAPSFYWYGNWGTEMCLNGTSSIIWKLEESNLSISPTKVHDRSNRCVNVRVCVRVFGGQWFICFTLSEILFTWLPRYISGFGTEVECLLWDYCLFCYSWWGWPVVSWTYYLPWKYSMEVHLGFCEYKWN